MSELKIPQNLKEYLFYERLKTIGNDAFSGTLEIPLESGAIKVTRVHDETLSIMGKSISSPKFIVASETATVLEVIGWVLEVVSRDQ